jgi:hypothetical protein
MWREPHVCHRLDGWIRLARHPIENFFAKIRQSRTNAAGYDKIARNVPAAVHMASGVSLN